jgi:hypothetical protein
MLTTAFATPPPADVTTNNFAVARGYALGWLQMWNVDLQRDLTRTVNAGVGYAGTRGSSLDIQRAPNRGANGVAIADVQPFIWEESGGHSIMHALSVRLQKRPAKGLGAGLSYTLSKSRDNASSSEAEARRWRGNKDPRPNGARRASTNGTASARTS